MLFHMIIFRFKYVKTRYHMNIISHNIIVWLNEVPQVGYK